MSLCGRGSVRSRSRCRIRLNRRLMLFRCWSRHGRSAAALCRSRGGCMAPMRSPSARRRRCLWHRYSSRVLRHRSLSRASGRICPGAAVTGRIGDGSRPRNFRPIRPRVVVDLRRRDNLATSMHMVVESWLLVSSGGPVAGGPFDGTSGERACDEEVLRDGEWSGKPTRREPQVREPTAIAVKCDRV